VRVVECKIEDPSICNIKKDVAKFNILHAVIPDDLPWPITTQVKMQCLTRIVNIRKMKWSSTELHAQSLEFYIYNLHRTLLPDTFSMRSQIRLSGSISSLA